MRRSSPVQQWLDSFPVEASSDTQHNEGPTAAVSKAESSLETEFIEETDDFTEELVPEDKPLQAPRIRELSKRKSLDSAVFTSTPHQKEKNKHLQRDYSVQSEGCAVRLKNPLFRDSSLQVCNLYL